ncbi:MAG: type II toxin-antitoxin system VapC family toxin [Deltaproteobacteria bacterium]|nr:type II toxin-antitoxin system VapC family toxin [Deltaproteobacteria bacterium]
MIALDASAFLAFLFREDGHEKVGAILERACLSAVNLTEVVGRFVQDGHDAFHVLQRIINVPLEIVLFGPAEAAWAASLIPRTRRLGLSLGDRACLGLAMARRISALTADRNWLKLDLGVKIEVIR